MKKLNLLFKIGEQFAEHEFDLDFFITLNSENGYNYEIYYYMKSSKKVKIYLAYNCDILSGVIVCIIDNFSEKSSPIKVESNTKQQLNYKSIKMNEREHLLTFTKQNWILTEKEIDNLILLI